MAEGLSEQGIVTSVRWIRGLAVNGRCCSGSELPGKCVVLRSFNKVCFHHTAGDIAKRGRLIIIHCEYEPRIRSLSLNDDDD